MSILVATDGETVPDQAVTVGADLAQKYDEELVVLNVLPQDVFEDQMKSTGSNTSNITLNFAPEISYREFGTQARTDSGSNKQYSIEHAERDAEAVAKEVTEKSVDDIGKTSYRGRVGDPSEEIMDVAGREDSRYLVIGGRKRSPVGKAIFGSVTQSVLLEADRPVVTVMSQE